MEQMTFAQIAISFVLGLLIGAINAYFAERRGRSPMVWFFIGALLGIFGLILLFILPSYAAKEEAKKDLDSEKQKEAARIASEAASAPAIGDKLWYYLDRKHQQCGPVPYAYIKDLLNQQELTAETYVWSEGMDNWKRINEL